MGGFGHFNISVLDLNLMLTLGPMAAFTTRPRASIIASRSGTVNK